ncbi:MAG: hypothetical protein BGP03_15685 [Pseudonocardia sp. 73-21]|jgi:hypothetical protein|nr:MAG: hypothetical protein BGP03_15685 [Pseudonocardia sp. 73-21]
MTRTPRRGRELDEALLAEQPQRLAQRRPADPETAGELLLDEPFPGDQRTTEDLAAQPPHRGIDEPVRW